MCVNGNQVRPNHVRFWSSQSYIVYVFKWYCVFYLCLQCFNDNKYYRYQLYSRRFKVALPGLLLTASWLIDNAIYWSVKVIWISISEIKNHNKFTICKVVYFNWFLWKASFLIFESKWLYLKTGKCWLESFVIMTLLSVVGLLTTHRSHAIKDNIINEQIHFSGHTDNWIQMNGQFLKR